MSTRSRIPLNRQQLDKIRPPCFKQEEELTDKLFAQILLDSSLTGTHLNSNLFINTITCINKLLKFISNKEQNFIPEVIQTRIKDKLAEVNIQFDSLIMIEQLVTENCKKLKEQPRIDNVEEIEQNYIAPIAAVAKRELQEKGIVTLPGGWISVVGGHAMCYQFIKETEGPNKGGYTFLIFNTGAGIQHHQETTGERHKNTPLMAFQIPPAANGLNDIEKFIQKLLAPSIIPIRQVIEDKEKGEWDIERLYDATRVYTEVIPKVYQLNAKPIDLKEKENQKKYTKMTSIGQLGGSCATRVLMPLLHLSLKGEAFQQSLYQIRLQVIVDYYRLNANKLDTPKVKRKLRKSLKGFGKMLDKMMSRTKNGQPLLTEDQIDEALGWIEVIGKNLELVDQKEKKQQAEHKIGLESKELKEKNEFTVTKPLEPTFPLKQKEKKKESIDKKTAEEFKLKDENETLIRPDINTQGPLDFLKNCYKTLIQNDKLNLSETIVNETEKILLNFPLNFNSASRYWKNLKPEEAREALQYLQAIQRIYGKHCNQIGGFPLVRQAITSETIRLSSVFIINRAHDNNPKFLHMNDPVLKAIAKFRDIECVSFDPKFDHRIEELEQLTEKMKNDNKTQEKVHERDQDEYDYNFLEHHLSPTEKKALLETRAWPPRTYGDVDQMRHALYNLISSRTANPVLIAIGKKYDTYLLFRELSDECNLFKFENSNFDYFKNVKTGLEDESSTRSKVLNTAEIEEIIKRGSKEVRIPSARTSGPFTTAYTFTNFNEMHGDKSKLKPSEFFNIDNTYIFETLMEGNKNSNQRIMDNIRRRDPAPQAMVPGARQKPTLEIPKRTLGFSRHLWSEGRVLTVNDLISANPEIFEDINYANYALLSLFTPTLLEYQLNQVPQFAMDLMRTIEEGLRYHTKDNELNNGGIFFLTLSHHVWKYLKTQPKNLEVSEAIRKIQALDKVIEAHIEHYEKMLSQLPHDPSGIEKKLASLYIIYSLRIELREDKKLTENEIKILLKSRLAGGLLLNSGENKLLSSLYSRNMDEMMPILLRHISHLSKEAQEKIIKESLFELYPDFLPHDSHFTIQFPKIIITHPSDFEGELKIDFLKGAFESLKPKREYLPTSILYDQGFIKQFGTEPRQAWIYNHEGRTFAEFNAVTETQKIPTLYRVELDTNRQVSIYAKPGKEINWYKFCKNEDVPAPPRYHSTQYKVLVTQDSQGKPIYYYQDLQGNSKFRFEPVAKESREGMPPAVVAPEKENPYQFVELTNGGEETGCYLIPDNPETNPPFINAIYQQLSRFETRNNIEIFQKIDPNTNEIQFKITLPRYKLEWNTRKTLTGKLELQWSKDPNYRLSLDEKEIIPGFSHTLTMENVKGDLISLIPKQEFSPTNIKEDDYYKLNYAIEGHDSKSLTGSEEYFQFKHITPKSKNMVLQEGMLSSVTDNLTLKGDSPAHYLQLAYIYLGKREPELALAALRHCEKIKGTREEIQWIERILCRVPRKIKSPLLGEDTMTQVEDPETCAVRLYAVHLLSMQKQTSFNKPYQEAIKSVKKGKKETVKGVTEGPNIDIDEFYHVNFPDISRNAYRQYLNRLELVPVDMRMPEQAEFLLLQTLYPEPKPVKDRKQEQELKESQEFPFFIQNKKKILNLKMLSKRKQNLLKKRDHEGLNPNETKELKHIEETLSRENQIQNKVGRWKSKVTTVPPPIVMDSEGNPLGYLELLFKQPENMPILTANPVHTHIRFYKREKQPADYRTTFQESTKVVAAFKYVTVHPIPLNSENFTLSMATSVEDFIYSFNGIYQYCLPPIKNEQDPKLKQIRSYAEAVVRSALASSELNEKERIQYNLCRMLCYVIKNPQKLWPKSITPESLSDIRRIAHDLHRESPYLLETFQINKVVQAKPINIINLDEIRVKRLSEHQKVNTVITEAESNIVVAANHIPAIDRLLNLNELTIELNLLERKFEQEEEKLNQEIKINMDQDPFLQMQKIKFEREKEMGSKKNLLREDQRLLYKRFLRIDKLKDCKKILDETLPANQKALESSLQEILLAANRRLTGDLSDAKAKSKILSGELQRIDLKQLIAFYLQGDLETFMKQSLLSKDESNLLYEKIHHYLIQATEIQHQARISTLIGNLIRYPDPNSVEFQSDLNKLGEQLAMIQVYDPRKHPEMLVFEYLDDKRIRKDQYRLISKLLEKNSDGHFNNEIVQMIMGGGKSKILLPLLALRKATGDNLSIIVVPEALYETNFADLSSVTEEIFGKKAHRFLFDRESITYYQQLQQMRQRLEHVISNHEYLITTAESLQSVELKYLDLLLMEDLNEDQWLQIEELEKILILLKTKGDELVDECDTVYDPKRELIYTRGEKQNIAPYIFQNIIKMYPLLKKAVVTIPSGGNVSLEDMMNGKKMIPTEEGREDAIRKFAEILIQDTESPLATIISLFPESDHEIVFKYLVNDPSLKEIPKCIMERNPDHRRILSLVKGEINLFRTSLKRKYKEHYGFPTSEDYQGSFEIAIPYVSSNTPNEKAQFGSLYEIINFTIQAQKQKDLLTLELIRKFISDYKKAADKECQLPKGRLTIDKSPHGKEFQKLTGHSLDKIKLEDDKQILEYQTLFSHTPTVHDAILLKYVLPDIKQYTALLRSNPINHADQCRTRQGFTGTPWNVSCFHYEFHFDEALSRGIDGQILDLFLNKMEKMQIEGNQPIRPFPEGNIEKIIQELIIQHPRTQNIHAIIDVGGLFKSFSSLEVAQNIAIQVKTRLNNEIRHILFFNENNELCAISVEHPEQEPKVIGSTLPEVIFDKIGSLPHQYFTFYTQRHVTGTDIKQAANAIGITTVDVDSKTRDLTQGFMRFREYANQQNIEIALSKAALTTKPANYEWHATDIINLTQFNQDEILGEFQLSTSLDNMDAVIRRYCMDKIMQAETRADKFRLRNEFTKVIDTIVNEDPLLKFSDVERVELTENILNQHLEKTIKNFKELTTKANVDIIEDFPKIERALNHIKSTAMMRCKRQYKNANRDSDKTVEVDRQREQELKKEAEKAREAEKMREKEREREQDKVRERERQREQEFLQSTAHEQPKEILGWEGTFPMDLKEGPFALPSNKTLQILSLNNMAESLRQELGFKFSENILVSENYMNTYTNQKNKLDFFVKPVNFFLVVKNQETNQLKTMIMTQEEADEFKRYLQSNTEALKKKGFEAMVVTPNNIPWIDTANLRQEPTYPDLLEQIRFYNGDLNYLVRDEQFNWIYENQEHKLRFLENYILPNHRKESLLAAYTDGLQGPIEQAKQQLNEVRTKLFEALKLNDNKSYSDSLKTFLAALEMIKNKPLRETIFMQERILLLTEAVKFGNLNLLSNLMSNTFLFGDGTFFKDGSLMLASFIDFNPEIFKFLIGEPRFWPTKDHPDATQSILKMLINMNNTETLSLYLSQASKIYGADYVEGQILSILDLHSMKRKDALALLKMLGTIIHKPDLKLWSEHIKSLTEKDSEKTYSLLKDWQDDSDNHFLREFRQGKWSENPSLLSSIPINNPLFLKLFWDQKFSIDPMDAMSWAKLFRDLKNRSQLVKEITLHIMQNFDQKTLQNLVNQPAMFDLFKESFTLTDKGGYREYNNNIELIIPLFFSVNNESYWKIIFERFFDMARHSYRPHVGDVIFGEIERIREFAFSHEGLAQAPFLSQGILKSFIAMGKLESILPYLSILDPHDKTHSEAIKRFINIALQENSWPLVSILTKKYSLTLEDIKAIDKATFEKGLVWCLNNDKALLSILLSATDRDINIKVVEQIFKEAKNDLKRSLDLIQGLLNFPNGRLIIIQSIKDFSGTTPIAISVMKIILNKLQDPLADQYQGNLLDHALLAIKQGNVKSFEVLHSLQLLPSAMIASSDIKTKLIPEALKQNQLDILKRLFEAEHINNLRAFENEEDLLLTAIKNADPKVLRFLLSKTSNISTKLFSEAIKLKNDEIIKLLIEKDPENAFLSLMHGIKWDDSTQVETLLKNGCSPNQRSYRNNPHEIPIFYAIFLHHPEIVKVLLQYGALTNIEATIQMKQASGYESDFWSPPTNYMRLLEYAVYHKDHYYTDLKIIDTLLQFPTEKFTPTERYEAIERAKKQNDAEVITKLIRWAPPSTSNLKIALDFELHDLIAEMMKNENWQKEINNSKESTLFRQLHNYLGDRKLALFMASHGAAWGESEFFAAIRNRWPDVLEKMLEHKPAGFSVQVVNSKGVPALQLALEKGDPDLVLILLKNGANPNKEIVKPIVPPHDAFSTDDPGVVPPPEPAEYTEPMRPAAEYDNLAIRPPATEYTEPTRPEAEYTEPMLFSKRKRAKGKSAGETEALAEDETNVIKIKRNSHLGPDDHDNLLMKAIRDGNTAIAKTLIEHGVNLLAKNSRGETAIEICEQLYQDDLADFIRESAKKQGLSLTSEIATAANKDKSLPEGSEL